MQMQLVAGVVQLLIFQHLALLTARAMPLECNDSITSVMSQIHSQIMNMHLKAKELFDTYTHYQKFTPQNIPHLCHTELSEFPKISLSNSEEDKLSDLYKIFLYMKTAMGNITQEQEMHQNPNNKYLRKQLNESKGEIAAVISNLSCVLNKRNRVPTVDKYYTMKSKSTIIRKTKGCKALYNYEHFLIKAAKITSDWGKNEEYTHDPSSDKQTPENR
ncbi:leukemia inhibitory factor isoform X2 [Hyla sarda]|uniref:leukemia inhibitory factor isoform X2 n=1 Tax=Hyla sarda TaxID=327740 RepID=UPI0024C2B423|nr:leukemia inhibitory factor isoform X2 [Hyla sarda]